MRGFAANQPRAQPASKACCEMSGKTRRPGADKREGSPSARVRYDERDPWRHVSRPSVQTINARRAKRSSRRSASARRPILIPIQNHDRQISVSSQSVLLITFNKSLLHAANFERVKTAHSLLIPILRGWGRRAIAGGPSILLVFWQPGIVTPGPHLRDCVVSRGR